MELMDCIFKRRSIRKYKDKQVDKEILEMLIKAATAIGLGSVWIGVYPMQSYIESVRKALNIPEYVVPLGIAYIGYADEEKQSRTQYNEKRIYWEKYDSTRKHRARSKNLKYGL
ncbi:nitroreductase family protein [Clostridium sp.]|jgi:nitroreductase|uniref:nitroreductase family protein n=1 Tax=Clostridium sp. TaxID=1506 RepID=UPI003EE8FA7A